MVGAVAGLYHNHNHLERKRFVKKRGADRATKVANELKLKKEQLKRDHLEKYKVRRKSHHIYQAAARLWKQGVAMEAALSIVKEAFEEATFEAEHPDAA